VTVSSFEIDRTEVTVAAFGACVAAGVWATPESREDCNWAVPGKEQHPVTCVSWALADDYCRWAGKRLPTEAEWELAARGTDGRIYTWGDEPPSGQLCWNGEGNDLGKGKRKGTCAVGSYPAGANGLSDMAGNVWEWVSDWYGPYGPGAQRDPTGPSTGTNTERVVRVGGWLNDTPSAIRAASRHKFAAIDRFNFLGFRCARPAR
jgi:formylglycine-generating enzyme required for sulfatase activity